MSSVILPLQVESRNGSLSKEKSTINQGFEAQSSSPKFGNMLARAEGDIQAKSGKGLPKEEEMPRSQNLSESSDANRGALVQRLSIREAGQINLIETDQASHPVDGESTGVVNGLTIEEDANNAFPAAVVMMDVEWLKLRGNVPSGDQLSIANGESQTSEPTNLAEALAAQILEPKGPSKSSVIFEVLAMKAISVRPKVTTTPESSDQVTLKLADLLPSLNRKIVNPGAQNQGGSGDSGSLSSNQFDTRSIADLAKSSGPQEFREFLAEHLKRAESLRELTDKLGSLVARQIAGQIGRGRWSLEIAMHPAELGSIEIEMEMTERGLEASFRASHSVTRDLLMESMPRLKSWFEEGGIDVAYAGLTKDSGAENGGNSTGEQNAQSEIQITESEESSDSTDNQLFDDGSTRLDIRV